MPKIYKHIFIQSLLIICMFNFGYCFSIDGIWIPEKICWETQHLEDIGEVRYAGISILHFQKDGTFKLYQCTVYPSYNNSLNIGADGCNIFKGNWEIKKYSQIIVNYEELYRSVPRKRIDGTIPETKFVKLYTLETSNNNILRINIGDEFFIKDDRLTAESKELIFKYWPLKFDTN